MSSIGDILSKKQLDEPAEIQRIKKYVQTTFGASVHVQVQPDAIIILSSNAALSGTLRLHGVEITRACQLDKKLIFKLTTH